MHLRKSEICDSCKTVKLAFRVIFFFNFILFLKVKLFEAIHVLMTERAFEIGNIFSRDSIHYYHLNYFNYRISTIL